MKLIRRMFLCALLLVVACVSTGCSVYREPAVLLDGIEFGMSPEEARAVLGEPTEEHEYSGGEGAPHTWLIWESQTIAGRPAEVGLKFIPFRRGLVLEQYTVTFLEEAQLTELDAELTAQLTGDRGFIRRDHTDSVSYECSHGPVGTYYSLSVWEGNLRLLGECDEYYR